MSRYTVDWDAEAEDDLAHAWMQANEPPAVTRAQAEAGRLLAQNPLGDGRHLSEGLYRMEVPPLIVNYTVDTTRWPRSPCCPTPEPAFPPAGVRRHAVS